MMARSRQRVRLEDGLKLNINKLIGRGGIQPGSKTRAIVGWPQRYGEQSSSGVLTAELSYPVRGWMRLEFGSGDHWLELVTEPRHFGGRQWYFLCPQTGRRASVLWKPPGARSFASRQAWGRQVASGSQFQSWPRSRVFGGAGRGVSARGPGLCGLLRRTSTKAQGHALAHIRKRNCADRNL